MNFPSIRIEGSILSPDLIDRLEDSPGQRPADFGLETSVKVKDDIVRAWADAQDYWRIFQRRLESTKTDSPATTETRQLWVVPLLGLLGYQLEFQSKGVELNGKNYAISHRVVNRGNTPVYVIGYREPSGLDKKPERANLRMSAHAMLQEYINLQDELFGIVTNGRLLRLLRDSSRLVKLSYLEFDLDRIFSDGLYADFAVLYRLLHATRLPASSETPSECLIEKYHQDSLESGARIREGLSDAVKFAILEFANGFLTHIDNSRLRERVAGEQVSPEKYYKQLLRLIYRILFLMVIEERRLVFPEKSDSKGRQIYETYYSIQRLRRMSERRYLADPRRYDVWQSLLTTFRLFEGDGPGHKLGIAPLAGDLFDSEAINVLDGCRLGNDVLLKCLRSLGLYQHPDTKQLIRVNYAALNVEEFGSVYEGLLEFKPVFHTVGSRIEFVFAKGDERSTTGSHYTPDDLVQPLIKHSLDYLIADKKKEKDPEKALLSLRVADIACGSGHILLAAARRIANELAIIRTHEEQPSPTAFRKAVRDVICNCIYGVDLNPLAVELCKVALWLEAHNPGAPLNFLDHHIKCGNSIVGFVCRKDVERGVPDEAFEAIPGDDREFATSLRKRNKAERTQPEQAQIDLHPDVKKHFDNVLKNWHALSSLPERTLAEIAAKKVRYYEFTKSADSLFLEQVTAIPIAQFFIPKITGNRSKLITDAEFRDFWFGRRHPQGQGSAAAWAMAHEKSFFHWFLDFPEIIERGGFDCILGNPPYLGRKNIRSHFGDEFCRYVQWEYAPAGLSDIVVYFVQRIIALLIPRGLAAFITTNSIKDGEVRRGGLEVILARGAEISYAVRTARWSGRANVFVSLLSIYNGKWQGKRLLDGNEVQSISAYLDDIAQDGEPHELQANTSLVHQGAIVLGDEFLLSGEEVERLWSTNPDNQDVVFNILNGQELNNNPDQHPSRGVIHFFDWPLERAERYVAPFATLKKRIENSKKVQDSGRPHWWQFWRPRMELSRSIKNLRRCFVIAATTKYFNFSAAATNTVFTNALFVYATDRWDCYSVGQSALHEVWAGKYSGELKQDLRYSPSDCFETFAFPSDMREVENALLADIGEKYHAHRKQTMLSLWLGLTDIYNLFHTKDLTVEKVMKVSKKSEAESAAGLEAIVKLRELHVELDNAVRDAYGWDSLDLEHGFYEVEILPENDRMRYTISPAARKEVLRRLLALNHERASAEAVSTPAKQKRGKKVAKAGDIQRELL